jgi:hypothetical protein
LDGDRVSPEGLNGHAACLSADFEFSAKLVIAVGKTALLMLGEFLEISP